MIRIEQFELRAPQVVALRLPRAGVIRVNAGRLWLTQSGRTEDVWLSPHESWTSEKAGTVWLSAEPSADFQIAQPALARRTWSGSWSGSYAGAFRDWRPIWLPA